MSKPPEKSSQQDKLLFSEAVSDITPLTQDKIIPSTENNNRVFVRKHSSENELDDEIIDSLSDEYDPFENDQQRNDLNFHHQSISKRQFHSLRKNHYIPELILDLHGINRQQARNELLAFIKHCQQHDFRKVAIMPGYGYGILRQSLNVWLRQLTEVLAFAESPQHSGGKGVIRVLLAASEKY